MGDYIVSKPITSMKGAFSVEGLNVIVTGGAGGIGRGISQAFAESGANVCIMARNEAKGAKAIKELNECSNGKHMFIKCDISDHDSVIAAKKAYFENYDALNVLVNNAGIGSKPPFLSEHGLEEWHRIINTDLHGVAHMCYEFAPVMRDAGNGGVIINISSVGALRTPVSDEQHNAPYNVSKAGVDIFTRYLAIVLGDANIRVLSIEPGPIHSDLDKDLPADAGKMFEEKMPAHRFGEPIEVGAFCVYLSSPAATFIRGVNYAFDGGQLCVM
ncbi:MAG: SDR family NAD(P)-dependent oxidoreductase [Coriobacteriales bacterium]|jgi:NAD(P)-dependent dehydrogenase (short-subunit alcohol dehydrogenase family)